LAIGILGSFLAIGILGSFWAICLLRLDPGVGVVAEVRVAGGDAAGVLGSELEVAGGDPEAVEDEDGPWVDISS
jgi:hypothetical protein